MMFGLRPFGSMTPFGWVPHLKYIMSAVLRTVRRVQ